MKEQTFKAGDKVKVINSSGCHNLTEGEVLTVTSYEPEYHDPTSSSGFTWPAHVQLESGGKAVGCHAWRVRLVSDQDN